MSRGNSMKTKTKYGEYFLGLDIGTNSVGWAITDDKYRLLRFHGKSLWGIRLFEEGNKADERRQYRSSRRRLQRKEQRISILQDLFAEEICKVDPEFFQRLKDSKYYEEDKMIHQKNTLFHDEKGTDEKDTDKKYTDKEYHEEFPTIYHLRKALIEGKKEYDVRLVYLAIHHIIKHRGHFLFEGQEMKNVTSFQNVYNELIEVLNDYFERDNIECSSIDEMQQVLIDRNITKTEKEKALKGLFEVEKTDKQMAAVAGLLAGTTKKLSDLYNDDSLNELEKSKICFADAGYDETREELDGVLEDRVYLLDKLKAIYDWAVLTDILQGENYLSSAKVGIYEKHKKDLRILKELTKKYHCNLYDEIFKTADKKKANYVSYIGQTKKHNRKIAVEARCSQEELCDYLFKIFSDVNVAADDIDLIYLRKELENKTFLPKQVSKDNGVIPYQVHEEELKIILENVSKYLLFLNSKDDSGYTVAEKILKTFKFRIPYYVGPINVSHKDRGGNCWAVRKSAEKVTPWNFEQVINLEGSAEEFIKRMTNKCTYLMGEDVLPKNSLLYSEYMVLNEINNIRINQEKISVELKMQIYNDLFKKKRKVTKERLISFLNKKGYELNEDSLSGFDGDFKSSLSSYLDFKDIFGENIEKDKYQKTAESIIKWSCLYGEDRKLLIDRIKKEYGDKLSSDIIKKIVKKKYTGWGKFSEKFLREIQGASKETGEVRSIINALRETNDNLMMLLSNNYTYLDEIDAFNCVDNQKTEITYDLIKEMYISPAVGHMLWQTMKVVKELGEVMGHEPKKVFIEMARGEEKEKNRKDSRKKQLYDLYRECQKETRDWCNEIECKEESEFRSDRLYLYYTQNGRCMYTGNVIPLDKLFDRNLYDIDHIYPQSKTKDDSLDNRVLVEKISNANKDNTYPIKPEIQRKQAEFWKYLKEKHFISQKKYERLTRTTEFSEQELAGFIARQIVETQQTMKAAADLLKKVYTDSEIVYVKARLAADFRRDYNMLKVREVNDYHHAKDAYLNIVVGNVYHTKFTSNPINFIRENKNTKYTISNVYEHDVKQNVYQAWKAGNAGTIVQIKEVMAKNNILYTRASFEGKGGLFNQTLYSKQVCATGKGYIPLKGDIRMQDISKYGGYGSVTGSFFFAVEHEGKKGKLIRTIETVPAYLKDRLQTKKELKEYCENQWNMSQVRILVDRINIQSLIKVNGFYVHVTGRTNDSILVRAAVQLCLDNNSNNYIKKLSKFNERNIASRDKIEITEFDGITREQNIHLYEILLMKHCNTIYSKRPNPIGEKLKNGKETFDLLNTKEQVYVLLQIIQLFQCANMGADLTLIGAAKKSGIMQISKDITKMAEFKIVNQSPTGLFENEIDLLKI